MFGAHVFLKTSQKMSGLSGEIFGGGGSLDVPEMVARGGGRGGHPRVAKDDGWGPEVVARGGRI